MSPKQILIVAIRLVVLIGIVQTLGGIATIFAQSESMYDSKQIPPVLMFYGLYLIAWLLLWCFPATIANRLLPEHLQTVQEAPKHPAPWLTTGIVLIGIYTVFQAIPDLIYQFSLSIFLYSLLLSTHIHPFGRTSAHKTKPAYLPTSRSFLSAFSCYSAHQNSRLGYAKDFNNRPSETFRRPTSHSFPCPNPHLKNWQPLQNTLLPSSQPHLTNFCNSLTVKKLLSSF